MKRPVIADTGSFVAYFRLLVFRFDELHDCS
jgi:hypothetical protein